MQYSEFKNHFINNVFVPYMNGDKGSARITLANIYRSGLNNPRGTMYSVLGSINETKDMYTKAVNELKQAGQNDVMLNVIKNYINFSQELYGSKHPIVDDAINEINPAMKKLYPKTMKFTRFIMFKELHPFLGKLKFLAKFL